MHKIEGRHLNFSRTVIFPEQMTEENSIHIFGAIANFRTTDFDLLNPKRRKPMKQKSLFTKIFSISILAGFTQWSFSSEACPMPIPYFSQTTNLTRALESDSYKSAVQVMIEKNRHTRLISISFEPRVSFKFSNGCTLIANFKYHPEPIPGACPRFDRVDLISNCK